MEIFIIDIGRSWHRLIFIMGNPYIGKTAILYWDGPHNSLHVLRDAQIMRPCGITNFIENGMILKPDQLQLLHGEQGLHLVRIRQALGPKKRSLGLLHS